MIKLGIPEDIVKFAMCKGVMDLITVIPKDELNPLAVNLGNAMILDFCAKEHKKERGVRNTKSQMSTGA